MVRTPGAVLLALTSLTAAPVLAQPAPSTSVAVFPLQAMKLDDALAAKFTNRVLELMRERSAFTSVMTPQEIGKKLSFREQQQLLACLDDRCAIVDETLVAQLGVTHLMRAAVRPLGETFVLTVVLLELKTAKQVASISEALQKMDEPTLIAAADKIVERMLDRSGLRKAVVAPPPRAPEPPPPVVTAPAPQPAPAPTLAPAPAPVEEESSTSTTAIALLGGGSALAVLGGIAALGALALVVGGVISLGASAAVPASREPLLVVGIVCALVGVAVGVLSAGALVGGVVLAVLGQRL